MKKLYTLSILIVLVCFGRKSLAQSVTFQFYHDLNNNCNYDGGEPLLYNLPGYVTLKYVNLSSNTITASSFSLNCSTPPISVSSPSLPATNTFSFILTSSSSYPTFSINMSCSSYTNLSYTGTNYLPIKSISPMSNPTFYTNTTGFYTASATTSVFPVCNNMANDSVNLYFNLNNIYSCGGVGAMMASRTYSLYLDNILLDVAITTGTMGNTTINGSMSKMTVSESYYTLSTNLNFKTLLSTGPLSSGNHLFELKSTPIYTPALSALNYSMTLNSVPCTIISGSVYEDCDNNCNKTAGDGSLYYGAMIKLFNSINSYSVYADAVGNFSGIVPTSVSQYSITSMSTSPIFTPCPAATATTPVVASSGYDFGYKSGTYVDPAIYGPSTNGTTNPGSIKNVTIYCSNFPITTSCAPSFPVNPGKIKAVLDKNFTYLNAVGATPVPNLIVPGPSGDTLIWNVANLNFTTSLIYVVSAQMSTTVTIGTGYTNYAIVNPTNDGLLSNNFSVCNWTVGLPYDPNNKISWASGIQPNGDIPLATTDLFYTINFQNIGTAPAINVKLADTLDVNLDWNTLQVISSSFPVQVQTNNVNGETFFNFNNINLPDSTTNEPGSHGYVHYRIKLKPSVPVNTVIKNRSHNYFDFMPAVATNQTKNKLVNLTGINEIERANSIHIAPNPVTDEFNISSKEVIQTVSVYNNLGQIILKQDVNNFHSQVDLGQITDGIYFVSIQFKDGSKTIRKVVKN